MHVNFCEQYIYVYIHVYIPGSANTYCDLQFNQSCNKRFFGSKLVTISVENRYASPN